MNTSKISFLTRQVQSFLPSDYTERSSNEQSKTFMTAQIGLVIGSFAILYSPFYFFIVGIPILGYSTLSVGILCLFVLAFLKRSRSSFISALTLVIILNTILSAIACLTDGYLSVAWMFIPIIPMMAILLISQRSGIVWSYIVLIQYFAVWVSTKQGVRYGNILPPEFIPYFPLFAVPSTMIVLMSLTLIFDRNRITTLMALEAEKSTIQQKIEEAVAENQRQSEEIRHRDAENLRQIQEQQFYLEESARHILDAMKHFALGNLTVQVQSQGRNDDISKIFRGFNDSISSVRELVQEVIGNVEQTNIIATHISSASGQMAINSEEQAAQITQIASAVEEMSRSVSENSRHLLQVSHITQKNGMNATQGATVVDKAVKKIEEVTTVVSDAAMVVERLGNSSAEIGEIVQVIEEIADQTNLLALNAAIEAARAGDQGRGFAVVADEVRKLAERTAAATKQIGRTIQQIQRETDEAVQGMKHGNSEVREGLTLAKEAGVALTAIVTGSHEVASMVQTAANAIQQQSSTSEEIAINVEQVSASVNETNTSLSEIAGATENLRGLTESLHDLVSKFNVGDTMNGTINTFSLSMKNERKRLV